MFKQQNKRVLIKLSGEALAAGRTDELYDMELVDGVAKSLLECVRSGYEIAVVVGAGNIWRGRSCADMDRTAGDRMGMLATVINSICLKDAIERAGGKAHVLTAVPMSPLAEEYSSDYAKECLFRGEIVVLGAGLGIPFLSTDTTGAVRAAELSCSAMLMAKNIDYIYTADPNKDPTAKKLEKVKGSDVLAMNLKAIDATATAFCLSGGMPIYVFGMRSPADITEAVLNGKYGTVVIPE